MFLMESSEIFPIRVGISYDFGLLGEDFSRESLKSGDVPKIFISTSGFNYFYGSDGPKVIRGRFRIEFREEEKDRIKEYFNDLVEGSWDKMESFFGSYGVRLPEKEKVCESLSKSFIEYLKGITSFFNEMFDKYKDIEYGLRRVPLDSDNIKELASEVSKSCLYSINIRNPDNPYVYLSFSDIEEVLEMDDERTHPLRELEKINLTKEDLEYLEEWDIEEDSDNPATQYRLEELKKKSKKIREVLEELAKVVFYGNGFLSLNSQSIDEALHIALSMGGRFYSLFPKVDVVKGPGDKGGFLVVTNIIDRTALSPEGQKIPFPAILVSIETSAKGENGEEVKLTYEGTKEVGPMRVGFGFLIEVSNTILEREYGNPFYEDEVIENIELYTNKEEKYVMVENRSLYFIFLRAEVNFKSGAMRCPASFSYLSLEEKEVFEMQDEVVKYVPKVFFTSLVFESPEYRNLDLDSFMDIYKPLLGDGKPEVGLLLRNLLPQYSLVTSIVSSYLGFIGLRESDDIRTPFGLYNGGKYSRGRWMESLIKYGLVPIAAHKPEERIKKGEEYKEESDKNLIVSDLGLYKYLMSNSGVIGKRTLYPFLGIVIAEKYLGEGKSDLCFSHFGQGDDTKVKITPKSWEEVEEEIKRYLPFKKVDGTGLWNYRSEKVATYSKDEILHFPDYKEAYLAEKTKVAAKYEEKVKEKTRKGLFLALSWSALADPREIGDVERIRKKLFEE
jgi:hypothetical protein